MRVAKVRKGGQGRGICAQLFSPEAQDKPGARALPLGFCRWGFQYLKWVGEVIFGAQVVDLDEPWSRGNRASC